MKRQRMSLPPTWTDDLLHIFAFLIAGALFWYNFTETIRMETLQSIMAVRMIISFVVISIALRYFWYTRPEKYTDSD